MLNASGRQRKRWGGFFEVYNGKENVFMIDRATEL
jgi:hypothetical protein